MEGQSIKIKIADREYPLKVNSPEYEEIIRTAAAMINRMVQQYQNKFPGKGTVEILSFMALNVCMSNITLKKQLDEVAAEEEVLVKELAGYLENIDKNSR